MQVALSAYMAIAAAWYAYEAGYGIACNEFDPKEENISTVIWIFYVSKVRTGPYTLHVSTALARMCVALSPHASRLRGRRVAVF